MTAAVTVSGDMYKLLPDVAVNLYVCVVLTVSAILTAWLIVPVALAVPVALSVHCPPICSCNFQLTVLPPVLVNDEDTVTVLVSVPLLADTVGVLKAGAVATMVNGCGELSADCPKLSVTVT